MPDCLNEFVEFSQIPTLINGVYEVGVANATRELIYPSISAVNSVKDRLKLVFVWHYICWRSDRKTKKGQKNYKILTRETVLYDEVNNQGVEVLKRKLNCQRNAMYTDW